MTHIVTVQGLQWGSEAKGAVASMIAHDWQADTVAAAWHPNAGHTAYLHGKKYVHSMLPMGALAPTVQDILLGPGSVIDLDKLKVELFEARDLLDGKRIIIHPNAAVLQQQDPIDEKALVKIGSTMKGSAAAAIRKMRRVDELGIAAAWCDCIADLPGVQVNRPQYDEALNNSRKLLVEGAQGFGLGLHEQFWPYCTSRDVSTAQLLADCRIPYQKVITVGVARTFPIRVANRFKDGVQIGTSGGAYPFQRELEWSELGREPELTTVTKLPRRIFEFSERQIYEAARIMQPDMVALTFCDYLLNEKESNFTVEGDRANLPPTVAGRIREIERLGLPVRFCSFGPTPRDMWQRGPGERPPWPLGRPFVRDPFHGMAW